LNRTPASSP